MMKKFIAGLILSSVTACWASFALSIPVTDLSSTTSSCNSSETENVYYYLSSNGLSTNPSDTFWNTVDSLIWWGNNGSSIDIWRNGVISSCNTWERISNVVSSSDSNGALVFLNTDNCVFKIPNYTKASNPTAIDAQIHYSVWYRKIFDGWSTSATTKLYYRDYWDNKWTCYPNWNTVSDYSSCPDVTVKYWIVNSHIWECINYRVFRCGDGLVNSPIWTRYDNGTHTEECDPASSDWKNRTDWKSCTASCKIKYEASSCGTLNWKTEYNSNYSSPRITETTSWLCGVGTIVKWSLSYNKSTWKYTWQCQNGEAAAVACNAQDLWCGDWTVQSAYEECDPEDTSRTWWKEWSWKTCNSSCKIVDVPRTGPSCSSTYDKKTQYTSTSTARLSSSDKLCDVWTLVSESFKYSGTPRTFTWKCTNDWLNTECTAYQQWCGDGVKNGNEVCDPQDTTNKSWWWDGCSTTCDKATYDKWVCGSTYHTKKKYMSIDTDRITQYTQWLCDKWTVTKFTKHSSSHIYTWQCDNHWNVSDTCRADQEWCGDWIKNGSEACDDGSKNGTSSSSCSATCTTVNSVSCGTQDWWTKYFSSKQTTPRLAKTSNWMCAAWLTVGTPEMKWTDSHIEWTCSNANGSSTTCKAYQAWCGDWVKNGSETCDDGSKNGTSSSSCSATCTAVSSVSCGTQNGWTKYFSSRQTTPWLTKTSNWMCSAWTVGTPEMKWTDSHIEWTCSNANGSSTTCKAYQEWCGDEILQPDYEQCDYNDKNETNWWNDGCDTSCEQKIQVSDDCDDTFYYTIRHKWEYTFYDRFDPRGTTRYLYDFNVKFEEKSPYDYNRWANPTFQWSGSLENGVYMPVSSKKTVIRSTPLYQVLDHPAVRSKDNIYIEYNIKYADKAYSSKPADSQLKTHRECVYYEISRCGDGVLDEDYGEECDPGSEWTKVMPDWRICNSDCKLVTVNPPLCNSEYHGQRTGDLNEWSYLCREGEVGDFDYDKVAHKWTWKCGNVAWEVDCRAIEPYCGDGILDEWEQCDYNDKDHTNRWNWTCNNSCQLEYPKWELVIDKTLQNKRTVERTGEILKWTVEVTAKWWDVTDFKVEDLLPEALAYITGYVVSNEDNLKVTWPTWPVKSWSNNVYTWTVKWTLKENHKLTLEIETEVVKMPKAEDDYKNVACVIREDTRKCDEDKPNPPKWELIPEKLLIGSKEITKTWDAVVWKLIVTASWWDVTDFVVRDVLPPVLWYSEYVPLGSTWLEIKSPITWTVVSGGQTLERIEWKVLWTLQEWNSMAIQLTTYAKVMPDRDYENVLCVRPQDRPESDNKCDEAEVPAPKLWIEKTFTDGTDQKEVSIKEVIAYKISFGNSWTASATITSIKDFLPKNIWYLTGAIFINRNNNYKTGTQEKAEELLKWFKVEEWVRIEIYGGMTLEPGDSWYIILTWRVLSEYTWNRQNFACIYLNDEKVDCDDVVHTIITKDVSCKSNIEKAASNDLCYGNSWNVSVTCNSTWWVADKIEILCDNIVQNSWTNISELKWTCKFSSDGDHKVQCMVNWSTEAVNWSNCEWVYTLKHHSCTPSTCFVAWTKVTMADWSQKNIEDVKIWEKVLWSNWTINTVLAYDRPILGNRHLWSINWSEYFVSDEHPFKTTEWWKSFDPEMTKWEIGWDIQKLKVWDILITSEWQEEIKFVDYIDADYNTPLYNFALDWDHTYYANNYLVHNKPQPTSYCEKHPEDAICNFASPSCFNVNEWNVSIETWEYLPFYLNIESNYSEDYDYKVYNWWSFDDFENDKTTCTSWTVALNSMECTYIIRDVYNRIVFKDTRKCLMDGYVNYDDELINAWIKRQKETYDADMQSLYDGTYTYKAWISFTRPSEWRVGTTDEYKKNGPIITDFWEYKFQIEEITFYQCKEWKWEKATSAWPVCQSNFVLTKPYTVQKTPSWNLTASTDTLNKFKEADGSEIKTFWDYVSNITPTTYNENAAVKTAMNNFITKYKKLAVEVNIDKSTFLNKNNSTVKVSKVPGKDIYFVDGSITIKWWTSNITKSFTIVQTNGSTTIDGNVNHNMMLLTNNNIIFSWRCTSNQTVKWIFYAGGNLIRSWVWKNDNLENGVWCSKWWLYVKWVLIWDGFATLMEKSRSHIEDWWDESNGVSKKTKVMNWASVVIEYSPSVFTKSTMPPGAEDFTTALSIYKQ